MASLDSLVPAGQKKAPKVYAIASHPLLPHLIAAGANTGVPPSWQLRNILQIKLNLLLQSSSYLHLGMCCHQGIGISSLCIQSSVASSQVMCAFG